MRTVKVLGDHLLVRRHAAAERSKGGLILPEKAREPAMFGTVVAVGPGSHITQGADCGKLVPVEVKVGDVVAFRQHGLWDFEVDGERLTIMREVDVLGVVEDAQPRTFEGKVATVSGLLDAGVLADPASLVDALLASAESTP